MVAIIFGLYAFISTVVALTIPPSDVQNISSSTNDRYTFCDERLYGSPTLKDCWGLLNEYFDENDQILRVFDQEEVRKKPDGSYPGLQDHVEQADLPDVVQLPRFVSRSELRLSWGIRRPKC